MPIADFQGRFYKASTTPLRGEAEFTITIDNPSVVDILVDLNNNGVYDDGIDVVLSREYTAPGSYTIVWDGRGPGGTPVANGTPIKFIASLLFYPVHFPIYDMEQSLGLELYHLRPGPVTEDKGYWDDSLITYNGTPANSRRSVQMNLTGSLGVMSPSTATPQPRHTWWANGDNGWSQNNTINTWTGAFNKEIVREMNFNYNVNIDLKTVKEVVGYNSVTNEVTFEIIASHEEIVPSDPEQKTATGIVLDDILPSGYTYVSHTVTDGVYNTTIGQWTMDSLQINEKDTLTIIATLNSSGKLMNMAHIEGNENDVNPNNNTDSAAYSNVVNSTNAVNDENSTWINIPVSGDVTTNDFDLEGDNQTFGSFLNQGSNPTPITTGATVSGVDTNGNPVANAGTLTFANDGTYTFTPANNFVGNVSIPYNICDDGTPIACDTAYLDITVSPLPTQANNVIANNDEYYTQGNPINGNWLTNDADPQGDDFEITEWTYLNAAGVPTTSTTLPSTPLSVSGIDGNRDTVLAGTIELDKDGNFTFVPEPGFVGEVPMNYTITDDNTNPATDNADVIITVLADKNGPANDPPIAGDDFSYTTINTPVDGNFIGNDYDLNDDPISMEDSLGNPITIDPNIPEASKSIINRVPTEKGGEMIFYDNGTYTYIPPANYVGPDKVVYGICDVTLIAPQPLCTEGTIHLLVGRNIANSTNAVNDENSTWINTPVSGDVTTNDFDLEGDNQIFGSFLNQGSNPTPITSGATVSGVDTNGNAVANAGTLTFANDGTYTFTPANNFVGNVSIPYNICDDGTPVACDTAYLDITVSPLPTQANNVIANNDEYYTQGNPINGNWLTNDADPQGDDFEITEWTYLNAAGVPTTSTTLPSTPLSVSGIDGNGDTVLAGTIELDKDGNFTFVPEPGFVGEVPMNYTITDDNTNPATDNADVIITVLADGNGLANDPPIAGDDFSYTTINTPVDGNFIGNDYDLNDDPISMEDSLGNPITIDPNIPEASKSIINRVPTEKGGELIFYDNGTYTYIPPTNYVGPDKVVYGICDVTLIAPQPLCTEGTIHLLVGRNIANSTNAVNDENSTWINTPVSGDVTTNDFDLEGDNQTFGSFLNQGSNPTPITSGA